MEGAAEVAPRVNHALLASYVGKEVTLVGKVQTTDGSTAVVESSDGQKVTVQLNAGTTLTSVYVEFIGRVNPDQSITELRSTPFGDSFDLSSYDELVKLSTGKYAALFV